jgi:PIN domain nuclease of toxin-antitoxin system
MPDLAVTDTHALLWFATGAHRRLGRAARRLFERADDGYAAIYVPTLVLVEVAENVRLGRVALETGFLAWEEALFASGHFFPVDLTREIVRSAETLYEIPQRGDRLIAATAVVLECSLVTRDPQIAASARVAAVW